jgi:hypothetical protein
MNDICVGDVFQWDDSPLYVVVSVDVMPYSWEDYGILGNKRRWWVAYHCLDSGERLEHEFIERDLNQRISSLVNPSR